LVLGSIIGGDTKYSGIAVNSILEPAQENLDLSTLLLCYYYYYNNSRFKYLSFYNSSEEISL
jgi:hypothetical protein